MAAVSNEHLRSLLPLLRTLRNEVLSPSVQSRAR